MRVMCRHSPAQRPRDREPDLFSDIRGESLFVMTDDIETKPPKGGGDFVAEVPVEKTSYGGLKAFKLEGSIEFSQRDAEVVTDYMLSIRLPRIALGGPRPRFRVTQERLLTGLSAVPPTIVSLAVTRCRGLVAYLTNG
jgi:hypothetical protein